MKMKWIFTVVSISFAFLLMILVSNVHAQVVTGIVTDAKGEALVGVSILLEREGTGTTTDLDGRYSLSGVAPDDTLVFSYTGMSPQKEAIQGRLEINVVLREDAVLLQDVVVIGYGTKQRRDITGAVASVATEDLDKKPFSRLENALQGRAAGVQVTQFSGRPGNALSVRIRGATSLSAGNEPLYVIDGVPVLSTEGIDPADVEGIEIMKDASASAIYGARAANGVVLITTKRGRAGQAKISLNTSIGVSQVAQTLAVLNADQYVAYINESFVNAGQSPVLNAADYDIDTDWQDQIYRDALTSNLQLSLSGGDDKTTYFVSAGQQKQEGIVRESDFKRTNFRLNLNSTIRTGVRLGTNLSVSRVAFNNVPDNSRVNQGGVILGALSSPPIIGIYNEDGTYTVNPLQAWENPVANIEAPDDVATTTRFIGNLFVEFDLLRNLTFRTSFGTETYFNKNDYFLDPFTTQFGRSLEGIATTSTNQELVWLSENTLTYQRVFGDHEFTVLGGLSAQESGFQSTFSRAEGFPNGTVSTLNAGSRKIDASSFASQWALFSYLGRISYKFSDRYLADFNFRTDGSSRFGADNRFAYFPSLSLGWRVSEEDFLANAGVLDDLKLRFSIGATGNQNIGDFSSFGLYSTGSNYNFNDNIVPGTRPSTIGNDDLKWETTLQYNGGLDIALFDFRVNITADYYYKRTSDLLINVDLPQSTGFQSGIQNLGEIENQGVELSLRTYNVRKPKFSWVTSFNISANRNKVIDIGGADQVIFAGEIPERGFSVIVREGLPLGSFYGYESLGVSPDNGNIVFRDINNDGAITDEDRTIIGDANPDFILGLGNNLTIGRFEVDLLFQGSIGNDVFNATRIETEGMFSVANASADVLNRWQNPGDITRIPRAVFSDPDQNSRISSRFIEDGSFVKLRNVTLSYRLPKALLERMKLQTLALWFSGQNLLTFTNYKGYDPEVNRDGGSAISQGIDYGTYPQARIYTGGLRVEF